MKRSRWIVFLLFGWTSLLIMSMAGCSSSGGGGSSDPAPPSPTVQKPAQIAIGVSSTVVKSDNSDSIEIMASVLDDKNVAVKDVTVTFSASGGALSGGSAATDEGGLAVVNFSAGLNNKSNRLVMIQAEIEGLPVAQVPVQIVGTEIALVSLDRTALTVGIDVDRLQISVTDAGGQPVYVADVAITVNDISTGNVSLSSMTGITDVTGMLTVTVNGVSAGSARVDVEAAGAIASFNYTVQAVENAFRIIGPTENPASLSTDGSLAITVAAPSPGANNMVVFATTVGVLSSNGISGSAINVPVVGGQARANLTSSVAGVATVQVSDFDDSSKSDSMTVAIFAPPNQARQITVQASNTVVAPSTAAIVNTVTIYATVSNASDQVVGGAPVLFALSDTTGGGETLSPAIAYTNSSGMATTTFTSGSLSSDADGVRVTASVLGAASVVPDDIAIIIGGTAGSVVVGSATKVGIVANDTAYTLAMSVIVSDSNGNPVPGAVVSLNLWPRAYAIGAHPTDSEKAWFDNEDLNRNLILDPNEDENSDGELTPPISSAGTIPASITADEFGVGTFTLTYLKAYAGYIVVDLTASTLVLGSETSSMYRMVLGWAEADEPYLGPSPFNLKGL